jgi:hypothetical protein
MPRLVGLIVVAAFGLFCVASIPLPPDPPETIEPPPWETASDFAVEIGRGWENYRAYVDGEGLPLTSGFQGGQHVHVSFVSDELSLDDDVERVLTWYVSPDDESLLDGAYESLGGALEAFPAGEGRTGSPFTVAFLGDTSLIGQPVELRVHIELSDGRVGRAWTSGLLDWEDELPEWQDWLCTEYGGCPDAGVDAGADDAGGDGGATDAGVDAGEDAGANDAGGDGGATDAGTADAGDGGTIDAGGTDAGDGGTDGGATDAGVDGGADGG